MLSVTKFKGHSRLSATVGNSALDFGGASLVELVDGEVVVLEGSSASWTFSWFAGLWTT